MIHRIAEQLTLAVAKASGNLAPNPRGLYTWSFFDHRTGGIWNFRLAGNTLVFAWRPLQDIHGDVFIITLVVDHENIQAASDTPYPDHDSRRFGRLGICLLDAIQDFQVPSCVHRELNDIFRRDTRGDYLKGALAESDADRPYVTGEPRLARDIGLEHPEPVVKEAFEKAQKMYQGGALDEQKDPNKLN